MTNRMILAGLSAAILATSSVAAMAAPCGPAVLSKVDGKVLVNRGVGFMDGKPGMPLAVGDHVMLRGGSAEVLFVNGTGSALSGAKSMSITACSADASRLTSPALAQFGGLGPITSTLPAATPVRVTNITPYEGGVTQPVSDAMTTTMVVGGGVAAAAIAGLAIAAGNTGGSKSTLISVSP
ncbi:hypothetical protein [Aquabacter cavernae]|uniref:hypothetical protein n=1 Tax=Aquabacter cavernae TaxID=2496029 RepID=UPI000F8CA937|nr:hypothetical protein [Aquabacter cavernae]